MKYRAMSPNLVYKKYQRLQLAWQTPRSIEEQARLGLFADHNLFAVSVFFFQHSSVQLLKRTNEIEKQNLELWADSERRRANNMVSKTTIHVRQATSISMVVGWTAESGCQESTVKSVKAKWTISVERETTLSKQNFLYDEIDSTLKVSLKR